MRCAKSNSSPVQDNVTPKHFDEEIECFDLECDGTMTYWIGDCMDRVLLNHGNDRTC